MTDRRVGLRSLFVYGTLRPGAPNYRRYLAGRTVREREGTIEHLALRGLCFPYAVAYRGSRVTGTVVTLQPDQVAAVLDDLDRLEGVGQTPAQSHYIRATRTARVDVPLPNGGRWQALVRVWIYLPGPNTPVEDLPLIPGGDWLRRRHRDARWRRQLHR